LFIEPPFEGRWGEIAKGFLFSLTVVEKVYVFRDLPDGILHGFKTAMIYEFSL